jgi:exodeoxyribonuclease V
MTSPVDISTNWSPQQAQALDRTATWLKERDRQIFYLAGFAGTGKTTLAQHLASGVSGNVLFMAFTGKAASVLRKRGCPQATTIHRSIYHIPEVDKRLLADLANQLVKAREDKDEEMITQIRDAIVKERSKRDLRFAVNPDSVVRDAALVVLDECSMVASDLAADLLSFGVPVLVLGDPGQLPPVKGAGYFTNRKPDITLTEIHRQAKDNPIIQMATTIREGGTVAPGEYGESRKMARNEVDTRFLAESDQVLTGTNKLRRALNLRIRKQLGFTAPYPQEGEKLVCLKNNHNIGLLNGVICRADTDAILDEEDEALALDISCDGVKLPALAVDPEPFQAYQPGYEDQLTDSRLLGNGNGGEQFDWGYAMTVHKSQGSQWPHITLVDDRFGHWDPKMRRQWLYTAVTRAQEKVTWLV